jgi:tetratricopeptide (TPR) repeat protein
MTEPETHAAFPSDETLAAFIDGKLDETTRRRVVEHMATCAECYDIVLGANELRGETNVVPFQRRRYGVIALVAAAAAVIAALFVGPIRERLMPREKSGLAALIDAAPQQRTVEGRLGGFPYQPLKPTMRSGEKEDLSSEHLKLESAALRVADDARASPTVENLHAAGAASLLLGNDDEAIKAFDEALHRSTGEADRVAAIRKSTDPSLLSDLAVAYISRGRKRANADDLRIANEAADRAWKLAPTPEHAWNRALAIERASGAPQAAAAWNDYLRLDPSSPWAAEAQKHVSPGH